MDSAKTPKLSSTINGASKACCPRASGSSTCSTPPMVRRSFTWNVVVPGAEAQSFEVLANCWARDAKQVFFQDGPVVNADPAAFGIIDESFARDAVYVFGWSGRVLDGADVGSFEQIGDSLFYRDKQGIYYSGYPSGWLEGADPATFKVGPAHNEGHDRQWTYRGCDKREARQD